MALQYNLQNAHNDFDSFEKMHIAQNFGIKIYASGEKLC